MGELNTNVNPWYTDNYGYDDGGGTVKQETFGGEGVDEQQMNTAIQNAVDKLVNGAPSNMDTFGEVAEEFEIDEARDSALAQEVARNKSEYEADKGTFALKEEMPTKVSELENDSEFVTSEALEGYAKADEVSVEIADAVNDMATETWVNEQGFLTEHQDLSEYAKSADVTEEINAAVTDLATKAEVAEVEGKIPTKTSEIENDSDFITTAAVEEKIATATDGVATEEWVMEQGFLTEHQDLSEYAKSADVTTEIAEAVNGLASEEWVNEQGFLTEHQDLSEYAKSADVTEEIATAVTDMATETWVNEQGFLTEHQDLSAYFNGADYNSENKEIEFKHDDAVVATIDASDFIKDGMVENVAIENGNLVITFNTESGKEAISIPLADIFNPDNYYTKTDVDKKFVVGKITNNNGSYALIFNESDGGGSQYFNSTANVISYVGTNDGDKNGICVQIYSKDKGTNEGTRINVNPNAAYYGVGVSTPLDEAHEIAVKGDITAAVNGLASEEWVNEQGFLTEHQDLSEYAKSADVTTEIAEAVNGLASEEWVNEQGFLKEHQDISDLATKEEVAEGDTGVRENILGRIWTNTNEEVSGYFQTKYVNPDGSVAQLWNESDGGGALYENKTAGLKTFVGVNADGENGVCAQIYSKHVTGNNGARLNVNPNGIYYGVGTSASMLPEEELAVKGDVATAVDGLASEEWVNEQGFLKEHQDLSEYAKSADVTEEIATAVTDMATESWVNEQGFLKEHQDLSAYAKTEDLASYVNTGSYNSQAKTIELKNNDTVLASIDATDFIKDGMVSNVAIVNGNLVITFNSDSGKEDISIPLTDIFNPNNYYTKTDTDKKFVVGKITSNNGSYALIFNESDGGGSQYFNSTANVISYVGTNDGDANGICVQIYSKNKSTNEGTRINVNPNGAYYGVGASTPLDEAHEVAVKGDIPTIPENVSAFANDAGYLTEHQSLDNYFTKSETNAKFVEKKITNQDGSYALMFNESDGGGSQYFNSSENVISYVGTNDGGKNGICMQIYSKDKATNEGTRINVNPNAAYYGVGASTPLDEAHEIAVKGDIAADRAEVDAIIAAKDATIASLQSNLYDLKKVVGNMGGAVIYDLPGEGKSFNTLMGNNGTVKLSEDVSTGRFGPGITASNHTTLNINNHNLTITGLTESSAQGGIMARGTQEITITGKGTIDSGAGICIEANGANCVINLTGTNTVYNNNRPGAELIYCYAGTINITNGTFKNDGETNYLLNCYDANYQAGTAKIIVTGGKFYDFDPGNNLAEGAGTSFLAEGYTSTASTVVEEGIEHTVYTVKKIV